MKRYQTAPRPPEGPRKTAWRILISWESGSGALEALREARFRQGPSDSRDKALVTELTQGTLRHLLLIDHTIQAHLQHPDRSLPVPVTTAIRLGAYQLMFLTRVPAHAAVKETVQIIKDSKYRRFSSLVNAVLRNIASSGPAPVPALSEDPGKHIVITTSTPRWLVDRLLPELGVEKTFFLFEAFNRAPPLTLRTNTSRTSREELIRELQKLGVRARAGTLSPFAVILEDRVMPAELGPFDEGLCTVQDEGAQVISPLLEAVPGAVILDACAAPGGKTGHLAEIQKDAGLIVAADISSKRLRMMTDNLRRLGTARTAFLTADLNSPPFKDDSLDRILLDVPCSGTGVLRRHPEGKWKKDLQTIAAMAGTQENLLFSAARILKRGGRLLYTTCSILKEENEDVVDRFLLASANMIRIDMREHFQGMRKDIFSPRGELRLWPHIHDCDGFYACLMEKRK